MDLQSITRSVRSRLRIPNDDGLFPPDVVVDYINDALATIASERNWWWLAGRDATNTETTADTASYTLPADWRLTLSVVINNVVVRSVLDYEGDSFTGSYDSPPTDTVYAVHTDTRTATSPGTLVIYPTPATTGQDLTHRYVRNETVLVANDDVPLLPDAFAPAVVAKACELATEGSSDPRQVKFATDYEQWLRRMFDEQRRVGGPRNIHVRPGGWP